MSEILTISSYKEFEGYSGKELGVSDYLTITQEQVNKFADATLDHQWIHIDPEKAAKESPFGKAIAHGYLTLSIIPHLWGQIVEIGNLKMMINYGIDKLKFNQAVAVNDSVCLRASLKSIVDLRGVAKAEVDARMEIKDNPKPAFTATLIFLYHFDS